MNKDWKVALNPYSSPSHRTIDILIYKDVDNDKIAVIYIDDPVTWTMREEIHNI